MLINKNILIASVILPCLSGSLICSAQNLSYARNVVDSLASPAMSGRGYVNNANARASAFIMEQMQLHGLKAIGGSFLQPFSIPMNTFPGKVECSVNNKPLRPGSDFIVSANSPSVNINARLKSIPPKYFTSPSMVSRITAITRKYPFLLIDRSSLDKPSLRIADSLVRTNFAGASGYVVIPANGKLVWSVSQAAKQRPYPVVEVLKDALPARQHEVSLHIETDFKPVSRLSNVIGYIRGTAQPDSFLVITAHYDHLGMMGDKTLFPGANDNASGVAMMLDLASYFSQHPPDYSIAFMAFAGEEAGLKGSEYYVENPVFPLSAISFLVNLDMVGTGSEGISVVNGKVFTKQYERLSKINADNEYVMTVTQGGEACNSDHCPFYKKGVPAIFIFSKGKEHREYHSINDRADLLPFSEYDDIFRLVRDFIQTY